MKIKAHQTRYGGTDFRSRLEATWAAFFDMAAIEWQYEPIDLDGWTPDFEVKFPEANVLVEVKPVAPVADGVLHGFRLPSDPSFQKAKNHCRDAWVMCLGTEPQSDPDYFGLGILFDPPENSKADWWNVHHRTCIKEAHGIWRQAKNMTRWNPS